MAAASARTSRLGLCGCYYAGQDRRSRRFLGGLDSIGLERWLAGAGRVSGRGAASRVSGSGTAR